MRASIVVSSLLLPALMALTFGTRPADANPNKVFAGRIMTSEKRYPTQATWTRVGNQAAPGVVGSGVSPPRPRWNATMYLTL